MKDKTRKCLECSKEYSINRSVIYCSKRCSNIHNTKQNQRLYKMNLQDGWKHGDTNHAEDYSIPTYHIPHNILQEAKHYVDLKDDLHIVEDTYEVFKITHEILNETCSVKTQKIKNRRIARRKRNRTLKSSYCY